MNQRDRDELLTIAKDLTKLAWKFNDDAITRAELKQRLRRETARLAVYARQAPDDGNKD